LSLKGWISATLFLLPMPISRIAAPILGYRGLQVALFKSCLGSQASGTILKCTCQNQLTVYMKPNFLTYFVLIVVTTLIFAVVYVLFKDVVETNPESFSIGLGSILLVGMYGMMNNIISNTSHDKLKEYE
jgi:hypothetical protein